MNSFTYLFVICAAGFVLCDASEATVSTKIHLVENIADFQRANPDVVLTQLDTTRAGQSIRYSLGGRVAGDRLVGSTSNSSFWSVPQNVQLALNYPANGGYGAVVSHLSVIVNQTSNQGRGYVVNGGIGQRSISVIIEAYSTMNFKYSAAIYGV